MNKTFKFNKFLSTNSLLTAILGILTVIITIAFGNTYITSGRDNAASESTLCAATVSTGAQNDNFGAWAPYGDQLCGMTSPIVISVVEPNDMLNASESGDKTCNTSGKFGTWYTLTNTDQSNSHSISLGAYAYYCTADQVQSDGSCMSNKIEDTTTYSLAPGESKRILVQHDSTATCGAYQTDLIIKGIDNKSCLSFCGEPRIDAASICNTQKSCTVQPIDLKVEKFVNGQKDTVISGNQVATYTIKFTNLSNVAITKEIEIVDVMDNGLSIVDGSLNTNGWNCTKGTYNGRNTLECHITPNSKDIPEISYKVNIAQTGIIYKNDVTLFTDLGETNLSNNTDTAAVKKDLTQDEYCAPRTGSAQNDNFGAWAPYGNTLCNSGIQLDVVNIVNGTEANNVCETNGKFGTKYRVTNTDSVKHDVSVNAFAYYCSDTEISSDGSCTKNEIKDTTTYSLEPGASVEFTAQSDSSQTCGAYQTDVSITAVDGTTCISCGANKPDAASICNTQKSCTVPPVAKPDLTIQKKVNDDFEDIEVNNGDYVTFKTTVINSGTGVFNGLATIRDPLPQGITNIRNIVSNGWDCSTSTQTVLNCTRSVSTLASGSSLPTVTFEAQVNRTSESVYTNTAEVKTDVDESNKNNNTDTAVVGVKSDPVVTKCSIGDQVWNDANNNGKLDNGETGIASATVTLYKADGTTIVTTTTTNASGIYSFTNLNCETYIVKVTTGASGTNTTNNANGQTVVLNSTTNKDPVNVDFGYYSPVPVTTGTIGDTFYYDTNNNGVQNTGETGIANVKVELVNASGQVVATTTTDANGHYLFTNIPFGTYTVRPVISTLPAGYTNTTSNASGQTNVTISATSQNNLTADFGYYKVKTCADITYNPVNPVVLACGQTVDFSFDPGALRSEPTIVSGSEFGSISYTKLDEYAAVQMKVTAKQNVNGDINITLPIKETTGEQLNCPVTFKVSCNIKYPDLTVQKVVTANTNVVNPKDSITYTISVKNIGEVATAGEITLLDTLPSGMTYVSASGNNWVCNYESSTNKITCKTNSAIQANATLNDKVQIVAKVNASATGTLVNNAQVNGGGEDAAHVTGKDAPDSGNNSDNNDNYDQWTVTVNQIPTCNTDEQFKCDANKVVREYNVLENNQCVKKIDVKETCSYGCSNARCNPAPVAKLEVSKVLKSATKSAMVYEITVKNTGDLDLTNLKVTDDYTLDKMTLASSDPAVASNDLNSGVLSINVSSLAKGATKVITLTFTPRNLQNDFTTCNNWAEVKATYNDGVQGNKEIVNRVSNTGTTLCATFKGTGEVIGVTCDPKNGQTAGCKPDVKVEVLCEVKETVNGQVTTKYVVSKTGSCTPTSLPDTAGFGFGALMGFGNMNMTTQLLLIWITLVSTLGFGLITKTYIAKS